jgi:hypothetical protein
MLAVYQASIDRMVEVFVRFERAVPAPTVKPFADGFVFRYAQESIHQALVLRLAGVISRLNASLVLLERGCIHEQGAMHRMIDEWNEDVLLLVGAELFGREPLHEQFLVAFFAEEHTDPNRIVESRVRRNLVPRRKVRAYIARTFNGSEDPHREIEVAETIGNLYSGYIHGAAQHLIDMYIGDPPSFHLRGMLGTPRMREHLHDTWNYFYRSLLSFAYAAAAFHDTDAAQKAEQYVREFQARTRRAPGGNRAAT